MPTQSAQRLDIIITRKLSYRKDDRAMRPGCLEKFCGVLDSTATFPEIFNGLGGPKLLFRSMSVNVRTKFEVRSFTRS